MALTPSKLQSIEIYRKVHNRIPNFNSVEIDFQEEEKKMYKSLLLYQMDGGNSIGSFTFIKTNQIILFKLCYCIYTFYEHF